MYTPTKPMPKVMSQGMTLGCDPEFFFSKPEVGVIGAESIIPKTGMQAAGGKIIIDGVQAELNPAPNSCRESLAMNIRSCFVTLQEQMLAQGGGITADFSRSIEISQEELAKLEKANQALGCSPSMNVFKSKTGIKLQGIDGSKHLQRSAGGHIHISAGVSTTLNFAFQWNHREIIQMLDLIVGNTCVLMDRDPANKERRKLYGKAGEYRMPKRMSGPTPFQGIEYRTLSNFWLTSVPVMSLVFGLTRTAIEIACDPNYGRMFYEEFTKLVPYAKVRHAINHNNVTLAEEIYRTIEPLLMEVTPQNNPHFVLSKETQADFNHFISRIAEGGMEYWFKEDPLTHWVKTSDAVRNGFCTWSKNFVEPDRLAALQKVKIAG